MAPRISLSLLPFIFQFLFLSQVNAVVTMQGPVSSPYYVVDQSNDLPVSDMWWTGCNNKTSDGQVCTFFPSPNPSHPKGRVTDERRP